MFGSGHGNLNSVSKDKTTSGMLIPGVILLLRKLQLTLTSAAPGVRAQQCREKTAANQQLPANPLLVSGLCAFAPAASTTPG